MQWARVKNILIVILLVVDTFLGVSLAGRFLSARQSSLELQSDVEAVLLQNGVTCGDDFVVPTSCQAMNLNVERNRAAEEQFASALLGGELRREEDENGDAFYCGARGTLQLCADGRLAGKVSTGAAKAPEGATALRRAAKTLLESAGISMRGTSWRVDGSAMSAQVTSTVNGLPVFGREIQVSYGDDGSASLFGSWTFSVPYAASSDRVRSYEIGDALMGFLRSNPRVTQINEIQFGYKMQSAASGHIQLLPVWRINTAQGEFLHDAMKKAQ